MVATMCAAETAWTDVTKRFVTNSAFDNNSSEGWTWEATTGTVGPSANCLRFYSGTCTFSCQLSNLPKGNYRLSVQGFYRSSYDSYESYKNGSENITAYLYANDKATASGNSTTGTTIPTTAAVPMQPSRQGSTRATP